jgi:hypothetical protein
VRIRIDVDVEVSERVKRLARLAVPAFVLFGGSVAFAGVPTTFKDGDTLSAQAMNENFASVDARLGVVEGRVSTKASGAYKAGATYCGLTATTTGDMSGIGGSGSGYAKPRAPCQAACGGSTSAHMCSGDELVRSAALGGAIPSGWYATAVGRLWTDHTVESQECDGYQSATAAQVGSWWAGTVNRPRNAYCSESHPVLCCD